ncbi:MAG TPA: rod shape-determining protein RodA [Bacteroidia bacterium]|nr:rod shape-determining protein RodA [Bacteroidota bacterium]MBP9790965.1 rod shape-determining protein RodA [Bacteroidia bacterium]MBK7430703.1 rod shape-determining protein RodA [Bacteroidota bacterium]MBK8585151.1 rod shape-determining protein RodA [Bacteroidota bacterium]MBP9923017.1 rod shape-determining protein RodA [Bacteroidia bacterium]
MGRNDRGILQNIDWVLVGIFLVMVLFGWMNIYAAVYNDEHKSILDFTQNYGKQSIWIVCAFMIALMVLVIDGKFYAAFSYAIYIIMLLLLLSTFAFAKNVKGSYGWIDIGSYKLQPAEFAKFATNMALAKFLSTLDTRMQDFKTKLISLVIIGIPAIIILLQNDTGSALVFGAFVLVLYREGLSGNVLLLGLVSGALFVLSLLLPQTTLFIVIGIIALLFLMVVRRNKKNILIIATGAIVAMGIVFSVDYFYNSVLQEHQRVRIDVLLGKEVDLKGAGYNVNQSKIAIGSGGFFGKGFLQGTQTKYDFVPEQSTDFIFCTVGEEWGFIGSVVVIGLFVALLTRLIYVAERQRSAYSRIYGYGVACILFVHLLINIGMTIGLAPVIGIPLPFFSYGGSSLWSFTILLFIFIRLDAYRFQILR